MQSTFGLVFAPENLSSLEARDVKEFLRHDVNLHWSGLHRNQANLLRDMELLRSRFEVLMDEDRPIAERYNEAIPAVSGLGKGTATAILHVTFPNRYSVWNNKSEAALMSLGVMPSSQGSEGDTYAAVNQVLVRLANELGIDLWTLDLLWEDLNRHPVSDGRFPGVLSTEIPHLIQSHASTFYSQCMEKITASREAAAPIPPIHVRFTADADGYPGDAWVQVSHPEEETFRTDWEGDDPTRFPARIRAATTALRDARIRGRFRVWHETGDLVILPDEYAYTTPENLISSREELRRDEGDDNTSIVYTEGRASSYKATRYERSEAAREACIAHYGPQCAVCNLDFGTRYGEAFWGYIHVHHLTPVADVNGEYTVDPVEDLRPVCPNCHAVIHQQSPPFTISKVREMSRESSTSLSPSVACGKRTNVSR